MEEVADMILAELQEGIDIESNVIQEEHDFGVKIDMLSNVLVHLEERLDALVENNQGNPEELKRANDLHQVLAEIHELLGHLGIAVSDTLADIHIKGENKRRLKKLKDDLAHKEWSLLIKDTGLLTRIPFFRNRFLRSNIEHLDLLHRKISESRKVIERKHDGTHLITTLHDNASYKKEKEAYERQEEYYFVQMYHFLKMYEDIFEKLLEKEISLQGIAKNQIKQIQSINHPSLA